MVLQHLVRKSRPKLKKEAIGAILYISHEVTDFFF